MLALLSSMAQGLASEAPSAEIVAEEPTLEQQRLLDQFERDRKLGRTGVSLLAGSTALGVAVPTGSLLVCLGTQGGLDCLAGGMILTAGAWALAVPGAIVGETLIFMGGVRAGRTGRAAGLDTSPEMAWTGAGLALGGTALLLTVAPRASALSLPAGVIGVGALVTGTALGMAQLSRDGRPGLAVLPTGQGMMLTGTF